MRQIVTWFAAVSALVVGAGFAIGSEVVVYKKTEGRELQLLVGKPEGWSAKDKRPAILFFFGGGWVGGTPEQFKDQAAHFARRGMVAVRVEYRTIPKGDKGPPVLCCRDAKSAVRHVRAHAADLGVDPDRIACAGGSAGGHLAAFTALVPGTDDPADDLKVSCRPNALVLFNPVFDNGPEGGWGSQRLGDSFRDYSPAHHIAKGAPPTLVFIGDKDKLIPVATVERYQSRMRAVGARCEIRIYAGAGHGFFNRDPHKGQTLREADQFLVSLGWLKDDEAVKGEKKKAAAGKPNVVLILADDLGYGDIQIYNPERGKIPTPNMDSLAAAGMRFTDAHSSSGVCSPSRYALLTGRFHWRTRLQTGIVGVYGPPLIAPGRLTLASMAKQHGYKTACFGKWHLGWDWDFTAAERENLLEWSRLKAGEKPRRVESAEIRLWETAFSKRIPGGPTTRGFDTYFGTDVPNWPPYAFIENDQIAGKPSELLPSGSLGNNIASLMGPALPGWSLEGILPKLTERACAWIGERAKSTEPFFLYMPLTTPHTPLSVNAEFRGKSGLDSPVADLVVETDAAVGRILRALDSAGAAENTLVILTSDNGFAAYTGAKHLEGRGHYPSGPLRDYKMSAHEGGHRVPLIVRWPGKVQANTVSNGLVHQADLMATLAELWGHNLPPDAGEDSFSMVSLLKGAKQATRMNAVSCAANGLPGYRDGDWKYIPSNPPQLYNLKDDLGERVNLAEKNPERVAEMREQLDRVIEDGRTTPGPKQKNDVPVKRFPAAKAKKPEGAT